MKLRALIRGNATVADLSKTLDELQVKDGEHFILANSAALDPTKPGFCVCGRPLYEQQKLIEVDPVRPESDDAVVSG